MRSRVRRLLLALLATLSISVHFAWAATVTVSTTADEVNGTTSSIANLIANPGGAGISLREAIIAANNTPGADIINLPAGTYTLTRVGNDANCQNGDLDINGSLTLVGAGPATTIIQAAANASFAGSIGDKVIGINQDGTFTNLTVVIAGVTIRYGRNTVANGDPTFAFTGAGIDVFFTGTGNSTTISNCIITGNENVNAHGGGINVDSGNSGLGGDPPINTANRGTVTLVNCVIADNKSKNDGAGINLYSDLHNVVITNCVVTNNVSTTSGNGAGINVRHSYGGTVSIFNCNVSSNSAAGVGGGINLSGNQHVNLSGTLISNNLAQLSPAFGGGLAITALGVSGFTAVMGVTNCTIANNHADNGTTAAGGGVYFNGAYSATLKNCILRDNTSDNGAGAANSGSGLGAALTLDGCLITNNSASASGGGLANLNSAVATTLVRSTLVGNSAATSGGGIYHGNGTLSANYNRIANNTAPTGRGLAFAAGTAGAANNWWGTNTPAAHISGAATFTPWLQLTHSASPISILPAATATLTASFLTNSAGTSVAAANLGVLVGVPVAFNNAVRGTVSGAQPLLQPDGTATATFTAATSGAGSADAVVDNQPATAAITVLTGVSSINRVQATPTNLNSVQWNVTFTGGVSGLAAGNFSLVNGGLGGVPGITAVAPVGAPPASSWLVTASTGTGAGTLGLNLINSTGTTPNVGGLPFNGPAYTIDLVPPALNCGADLVLTTLGNCPIVADYTVTASDNLGLATVTTNPPPGSLFPVGTNTVTLGARDTAGNTNFCAFRVIVLPGAAPQLGFAREGNRLVLSWPRAYGCYTLQSAGTLASNDWSQVAAPYATNGPTIYVTNALNFSNRYFRLTY